MSAIRDMAGNNQELKTTSDVVFNKLALTTGITVNTYTPTMGDGTNNFTATSGGQYITLGNMVWFWGVVNWSGKGSASAGAGVVFKLPLTSSASVSRIICPMGYLTGITYNADASASNPVNLAAFCNGGASSLVFYTQNANGTTIPRQMLVSNCQTAGEIQINGFYFI